MVMVLGVVRGCLVDCELCMVVRMKMMLWVGKDLEVRRVYER